MLTANVIIMNNDRESRFKVYVIAHFIVTCWWRLCADLLRVFRREIDVATLFPLDDGVGRCVGGAGGVSVGFRP